MKCQEVQGHEEVSVRDLRSLLEAHDEGVIRLDELFARGGGCRIRLRTRGLTVGRDGHLAEVASFSLAIVVRGHLRPPRIVAVPGTPAPFHPHFTFPPLDWPVADPLGLWLKLAPAWRDPRPHDGTSPLGDTIRWLRRSLAYDPAYVPTRRVVNPLAFAWFSKALRTGVPLPLGARAPKPRGGLRILARTEPEARVAARPIGPILECPTGEEAWEGPPTVYLMSSAMHELRQCVDWGRFTPRNTVEQGGLLIGRTFRDYDSASTFTVVETVIPAETALGTSVHLTLTHRTWKEMLDRFDGMLGLDRRPSELRVMGWYHTHPNSLDVFMSGTDRATQQALFSGGAQFALVLNPHRRLWRAFRGADCQPCHAAVVVPEFRAETVVPSQ